MEAKDISVVVEGKVILNDISFCLTKNEALAVIGASGSGKTTLGKVIAGQIALSKGELVFPQGMKRIFIPQQHDFRYLSSTRSYYQQRYDSNVADDSPTVEELLMKVLKDKQTFAFGFLKWIALLKLEHLLTSRLTLLSNGEGKRVQLAQALLQESELIVLDNPFVGLDVESRQLLHDILAELIHRGIMVIVLTTPQEIPLAITHVLELSEGRMKQWITRDQFVPTKQFSDHATAINHEVLDLLGFPEEENFSIAVEMRNVTVNYGDKIILDRINWCVKRGEQWALVGHNGAGKSTLLSLINGDNPQAYSNEIYLFDHRRGTGESIWDIKKKIGYISPELHIYFQRDVSHTEAVAISSGEPVPIKFSQARMSCEDVVASGFNDQVGSTQAVTPLQRKQVLRWMDVLQIKGLKDQNLYDASLGEQRLVMLARALVKNPVLLILDEPCQGLDAEQTKRFTEVVDAVCIHFKKTMIYISHYKQDIPKCVQHVLTLEKGKVISS